MRTLDDITTAVRRGEPVEVDELTYAVVAYDVLLSKLDVAANAAQLKEYFKAGESDPREYAGPMNDPKNQQAIEWHKAFIGIEGKL